MIIYDKIIQGSPEWLDVKRGKFSCSTLSDLFMAKSTKGYNDAINKIVFERLTGETPESYVNQDMKNGTEREPYARERYQMDTFNDVEQVGFIEYNSWFGFSPDGLVGEDGLIEIKCPRFTTLIDFALTRKIPSQYMYQMQGGMFVSDRKWCDFIMWHPGLNIVIERVQRDDEMIIEILSAISTSAVEVEKRIKRLK